MVTVELSVGPFLRFNQQVAESFLTDEVREVLCLHIFWAAMGVCGGDSWQACKLERRNLISYPIKVH